jgi:hypothetical protein
MTELAGQAGDYTLEKVQSLKESSRDNLDRLGTVNLAYIYGLSHLPDNKDAQIIDSVDKIMDKMKNPVAARFALGYALATDFFDTYSTWKRDYDADAASHREMADKITRWMSKGLKNRPNDEVFKACTAFVVSRAPTDTFLDEEHVKKLEEAAGEKLSIQNIPDVNKLLGELTKKQI